MHALHQILRRSGVLIALATVAVATSPRAVFSQIVLATDNAGDATYATDLSNGQNAGSGFGAWQLSPNPDNGTAGFFTFTSGDNGGAATIDTSSRAWGLYANSASTASAVRPISTALKVNDTFRIRLDNGNVAATRSIGWGLRSSGTNRVEFIFAGGGTEYSRIDNAGTTAISGFGFTNEAVEYAVTITGANTYSAVITPTSGGPYNVSGTLSASGSLNEVRVFNFSAGSAASDNVFANSISVTDNAPTLSSLTRTNASPSKFKQLNFTATFNEPVSGLTASNFALATSGITGAQILSVTPNGGAAPQQTWNIVVDSGSGATGTIGLDLANNTGILDSASQALTNATLTGEVYSIDRSLAARTWTSGADAGRGDFFIGVSGTGQPTADYATLEAFLRDFNGARQLRASTATLTSVSATATGTPAVVAGTNFTTDPNFTVTAGDTVYFTSNASGTVAVSGNTVTGTSTNFLNQVAVGDVITVSGNMRTVATVASATSLTFSGATATVAAGTTMSVTRTRTVNSSPAVTATSFSTTAGAANGAAAPTLTGVRAVTTTAMAGNVNLYILSDLTEAQNICIGKDTAGFTLRVKPYEGVRPTVTFSQTTANVGWPGHLVIGTSALGNPALTTATNNVIIDGSNQWNGSTRDLTILTGTSGSVDGVIRVVGASTGFQLRNTNLANLSTGASARAVTLTMRSADGSTNLVPLNAIVDNNFIATASGTTANGGLGVDISSINNLVSGTGLGATITNNVISANTRGVQASVAGDLTISGNTFRMTGRSAGGSVSGVLISGYNGGNPTINITGNYFDRNEVALGAGAGLQGALSVTAGPTGTSTLNIRNNVIGGFVPTNTTAVDGLLRGIDLSTGVANPNFTINIEHNSIAIPATTAASAATAGRVAAISANGAAGTYTLNVRNNNIRMGFNAATAHAIFVANATNKNFSGNNVVVTGSTNFAIVGATPYANFANFQTLDLTAQNFDSFAGTTNRWASAADGAVADFHFTGAPAGLNPVALLGGVTTDLDGDTRTVGNNLPGCDVIGSAPSTYTWNGGATGSFQLASNWSPARTTPRWNDILVVDGSASGGPAFTILAVPPTRLSGFRVINNASVTLNGIGSSSISSAIASPEQGHQPRLLLLNADNVVTVPPTASDAEFRVGAGSTLTLGGGLAITLDLTGGSTGHVLGDILAASTVNNNAHRIFSKTVGGLVFDTGSTFAMVPTATGALGGFTYVTPVTAGNYATLPVSQLDTAQGTTGNSGVIFASGSAYHQGATKGGVRSTQAGIPPFGVRPPNTVVTFQSGSSYVTWLGLTQDLGGRQYGNYIYRSSGASATSAVVPGSSTMTVLNDFRLQDSGAGASTLTFGLIGSTGSTDAAVIGGNFIVEVGNTTFTDSGTPTASSAFRVAGNFQVPINVSGTPAQFNPNTNANRVYVFNGTAAQQTIDLAGGTYSNLTFDNPMGFVNLNPFTVTNLALTQGVLGAGSGSPPTITATGTITRTSGRINGPLVRGIDATVTGNRDYFIGTTAYAPFSANITAAGTGTGTLRAESVEGAVPNLPANVSSINRRWVLNPQTITGYTATLSFTYDDGDLNSLDESKLILARYDGAAWTQYPTTINAGSNTATAAGVTAADIAANVSGYWTLYVPTPILNASTVLLDFGSVTAGQTLDLTVNLTNTGTANTTVTSVTLPLGYSLVSPTLPFVVSAPPTSFTTVTVRYSPTAATTYSGTATVLHTAANGVTVTNPTFNLTGTSTCSFTVSPTTNQNFGPAGGTSSPITVTTGSGCGWTVTNLPTWVTVTNPASLPATGGTALTYSVAANTGAARSRTISIAGRTHTINQAEGIAPTITLSSTSGTTTNGAFTVTATLAEAVTGFTSSDVTVTNGTVSSFAGSGAGPYTFLVTPTVDGTVTVEVPAASFTDLATNANTASNVLSRTIESVAPVVDVLTSDAGETKVGGAITGTYNVVETGSGVASATLYVRSSTGSWASAGTVTGGTWSFTPVTDGIYLFTVVATDVAGNVSEVAPTGTSSPTISVTVVYNDVANSSLTIAIPAGAGTYTFPMQTGRNVVVTFNNVTTPGTLSISRATGNTAPTGYTTGQIADQRWILTPAGGLAFDTATLEFGYDEAALGTGLTEGAIAIAVRDASGVVTEFSATVNTTANTATVTGVTGFSTWYIGAPSTAVRGWSGVTE